MKTILRQIDYYNDEEFSKAFLSASFSYLSEIAEKNSEDSLKRIKFYKLKKVAEDLNSAFPGDDLRQEKKLFIKYLQVFVSRPITDFSLEDLLVLERDYLLPAIDGKLREIGWLRRYGWLMGLFFVLPFDIFLLLLIGKYYFYFPILSVYFLTSSLLARSKAKKKNRLW